MCALSCSLVWTKPLVIFGVWYVIDVVLVMIQWPVSKIGRCNGFSDTFSGNLKYEIVHQGPRNLCIFQRHFIIIFDTKFISELIWEIFIPRKERFSKQIFEQRQNSSQQQSDLQILLTSCCRPHTTGFAALLYSIKKPCSLHYAI